MSFKTKFLISIAAVSFAAPAWAEIGIHDAYARSSNPVAGAAFMVIHNHGDVDDRLVNVTSDASARVEFHTHVEDADGVMRMTHVEDGFDLPAGGELILERGMNHVMFMGLNTPFEQDGIVTITFEFEHADDVLVEIPVDQDRGTPDDAEGHSDSDHSDHGGAHDH